MKRSDNYRCIGKKERVSIMVVAAAVVVAAAGCRSLPQPSGTAEFPGERPAIADRVHGQPLTHEISKDGTDLPTEETDAQARTSAPDAGKKDSDGPFPTFKETDRVLCTDDRGRPLILLFSASSCAHCQWVGGVFDLIAREYADRNMVAAHHYDIETGDDLLTETVETRIPEKHLSIGKRGDPDGYIPYFSFGCRYDRIGTGYEDQDDLAAEAEEMCHVIEALLP